MPGTTDAIAWLAQHLPGMAVAGWVVRIPLVSHDEGHEAITRAAWDGLDLTDAQQAALLRGVRAPDIGLAGLLVSALPFAQRRHALRAWSGTSTADGVRDVRAWLEARHLRALSQSNDARRWAAFGEILHCLQDSYSPAHVERDEDGLGPRILRMKHWGPFDRWRGDDEHGFPTDARDAAVVEGALTEVARAAADASRAYLGLARSSTREIGPFLDAHLVYLDEPAVASA